MALRTSGRRPPPKAIAALVGAVLMLLVVVMMMSSGPSPPPPLPGTVGTPMPPGKVEYSIMFDAGSSGSRIHVFKFLRPAANPHDVVLIEEMFEQLKPGLSAYAKDPVQGAASLKPLLDSALRFIPPSSHATTPIALRATAGLRMLPGSAAQELLDASYSLFREYSFKLDTQDKAVFIMDGLDEGFYAWVTVNYLLGRLGKPASQTVGVMDLGGGSTQIAFAVDNAQLSAAESKVYQGRLHSMTLAGRTYNLYAHSYLGYGLNSARGAILKIPLKEQGHPCLPAGYTDKEGVEGKAVPTPAECGEMVKAYIERSHAEGLHKGWERSCEEEGVPCGFEGVPQPRPSSTMQFFALSFLYDLAQAHGISAQAPGKPTHEAPVEGYHRVAKEMCGMSIEDQAMAMKKHPQLAAKGREELAKACIDFTYSHALLTAGYHQPDNSALLMAQSIEVNGKSVETQWCLGAALQLAN